MVNSVIDPAAGTALRDQEHHPLAFNLMAIGLAVALGGLGLAYLIDGLRQGGAGAEDTVTRTLGSRDLTIPSAWIRGEVEPAGGFAKEVDFTVTLPLGPDGAGREVNVALVPRSQVRPSASLLDGVYLHQFMPEQLNGPPGLVGKPLMAREGYENETVWYDALSPAPFVAKCLASLADGVAGQCLRTVYLETGIAAVYSFGDDMLPNWRRFDAAMHPILKQIGAL